MQKFIRSPLLSSKVARQALGENFPVSTELQYALNTIDSFGSLYDALAKAQKSINPQESPEARAMRYEKQYQQAVAKVERALDDTMGRIEAFKEGIRAAGLFQAGLKDEPKDAAEIRAALRSMTPKERDKAIKDAFDSGDAQILTSIRAANPVTWGGSSMPLEPMFDAFIDRVTPELVKQRAAMQKVTQSLKLATEAFFNGAEEWRDPLAAEKGRQQQAEFERAEAELKAAMGD